MLKPNKAYLLLEVLIALAILSGGLVAIISSFSNAIKAEKLSEETTIATYIACDVIEKKLIEGYPFIGVDEGTVERAGRIYNFRCVVSPFDIGDKSISNIRKIDVIVMWGKGHKVELSTLMAKRNR